jgi:hypothetical protein
MEEAAGGLPFFIGIYHTMQSCGSLDVSGINSGMYIIELSSNEYKTSGKLVKK